MTPATAAPGAAGGPGEMRSPPDALPPLHSSEAKLWLACPRKWHHAHVSRRVARVQSPALQRGTAVHLFLAPWWNGERAAALAELGHFTDPVVVACCLAYDAYWGEPPRKTVATIGGTLVTTKVWRVEVPFETWLLDEDRGLRICVAGTLDACNLAENPTTQEDLDIIEHKTTSEDISPGSPYWARVTTTDLQVSLYRASFHRARVVYDVIRKPKAERRQVPERDEKGIPIVTDSLGYRVPKKDGKGWRTTGDSSKGYTLQTRDETDEEMIVRLVELMAENPAAYFQRAVVVRLEAEDEAFFDDVIAVDRLRRRGPWPRNPGSCNAYGQRCEYFGVCWGSDSLADDVLFTDQDPNR